MKMSDIVVFRYTTCPVGAGLDVLAANGQWYIYCQGTYETIDEGQGELVAAGVPERPPVWVDGNDSPEAAADYWYNVADKE